MAEDLSPRIVAVLDQNQYSVGMGFLCSETTLFTCTHVLLDALGLPEGSSLAGKAVNILLSATRSERVVCQATVTTASDFHDETNAYGDIAQLQLSEAATPVPYTTPLQSHGVDEPTKMYGFGLSDTQAPGHQRALDNGRWVKGVCVGPNRRDWVQIDTEQREVLRGFSGGPVFNRDRTAVLGMLVARDKGEGLAHMIPAKFLGDVAPRTTEDPIVAALCALLDRQDQISKVKPHLKSGPCKCFFVSCEGGDGAAYFARKVNAFGHLSTVGLKQLSQDVLSPTNIYYSPSYGSFIEKVEEDLREDFCAWIKKLKGPKVLFVTYSEEGNFIEFLEAIAQDIGRINAQLHDDSNLQPCIIIAPYYDPPKMNFIQAFQNNRRMSKLCKQGIEELPKLGLINKKHLDKFVANLPNAAQKDFIAKSGDGPEVKSQLTNCIEKDDGEQYDEVIPKIKPTLQSLMHQRRL